MARKKVSPEDLAKLFKEGSKGLVEMRKIFFPSDDEVESPEFHYRWGDILLNGVANFAIEAFRESGKSQIAIRGFFLYCLVYPSKARDYVILMKANQTLAESKLREIEDEFLNNPIFAQKIIEIKEKSAKAFEVVVFDEQARKHTVRIEAYGKGASVRGLSFRDRRPKIVVLDDIQDLEDSNSETTLERDWQWFLSDIKFLGKKTRLFLIGNNLGEKCIIERVINNKEKLGFEVEKIPALDKENKSAWEEMFPTEFLLSEKEAFSQIGRLNEWYRERMCEALADESRAFRRTYFKYVSYLQIERIKNESNAFIFVDPAISKKTEADFTAMVVLLVDEGGLWYVAEVVNEKVNPSELINLLFNLVLKYKPTLVAIEAVQYQQALKHFIDKEMPRRGIFFNIEEIKTRLNKELRIKALEPRYKCGSIYHVQDADWLNEFEAQLLSFPKGTHDDMIDALSFADTIAYKPIGKSVLAQAEMLVNTDFSVF